MHLTILTVLVGIPLYQLFVHFGSHCRINMLKRMGVGLLCCFTSEIVNIVIVLSRVITFIPKSM